MSPDEDLTVTLDNLLLDLLHQVSPSFEASAALDIDVVRSNAKFVLEAEVDLGEKDSSDNCGAVLAKSEVHESMLSLLLLLLFSLPDRRISAELMDEPSCLEDMLDDVRCITDAPNSSMRPKSSEVWKDR